MQNRFYIAAPFFDESQVEIVDGIEKVFDLFNIEYFSPRSEGVLLDFPSEDRHLHTQKIYDSNIKNMQLCDCIIAVVDGRDIGTIFEIGYFTRLKHEDSTKKIITFTNENFGLNVMIQKSVDAHIFGGEQLIQFLGMCRHNLQMTETEFSMFRNFDERVF